MKYYLIIVILITCSWDLEAHTINYILDKKTGAEIFSSYLQIGFEHILPQGLDHILFITCVFFLDRKVATIIKQATVFTIAHSITLALVSFDIIAAPSEIIEPIIALSIAALAIENIFFAGNNKPYRYIMIFLFGLVHGMGFASALADLGLPKYDFANALLSFNLGVELGQLTVIGLLFILIKLIFENKIWYRSRIVNPINFAIAMVAFYWTIERICFK